MQRKEMRSANKYADMRLSANISKDEIFSQYSKRQTLKEEALKGVNFNLGFNASFAKDHTSPQDRSHLVKFDLKQEGVDSELIQLNKVDFLQDQVASSKSSVSLIESPVIEVDEEMVITQRSRALMGKEVIEEKVGEEQSPNFRERQKKPACFD